MAVNSSSTTTGSRTSPQSTGFSPIRNFLSGNRWRPKKYVLPNIPYLFVLWACLKLGTAYRLAAGADFAHKLMGLGQTISPAFADFPPGLAPFDWLIGIVGAVGFRLLIYFKSKNAKKVQTG